MIGIRSVVWLAMLLVAEVAVAAGPAEQVLALAERGRKDKALDRCERLGAVSSSDAALRDACSSLEWPVDETVWERPAWVAFAERWRGTELGGRARRREAELALSEVGYSASEAQYLAIAEAYPDLPVAADARSRAAQAAVLAVTSAEEARGVAARWPEQLPELVRRQLGAFVSLTVEEGRYVDLRFEPASGRPADLSASWVLRMGDGSSVDFVTAVRDRLIARGVPEDQIPAPFPDEGRPGEGVAPYPACVDVDLPAARVGVLVRGGGGEAFFEAPWDAGCGPEDDAGFILVDRDRVVGWTTGRGHVAWFGERPGPWLDTRALAGRLGTPMFADGRIWTRGESGAFIVQSARGGEAWLGSAPNPSGIPRALVPEIGRTTLPAEWRAIDAVDGQGVDIDGPRDRWRLPKGQVRAVDPLVAGLFGLEPSAGISGGAPRLGLWPRDALPDRAVAIAPPRGDIYAVVPFFAQRGLPLDGVTVTTALQVDLDGDRAVETIAEGTRQGQRFVFVVDGAKGRGAVWATRLPDSQERVPFAFQRDGRNYVGWMTPTAIEVLRGDGVAWVFEVLTRPG